MVKKTTTYCFCEFVFGKYNKHNKKHLMRLFNGMTYHEKMDILSMQFSVMWNRIYRNVPRQSYGGCNKYITKYIKKKLKFDTTFTRDGGVYIKSLISKSTNTDTEWEIPKGRYDSKDVTYINTAIREFNEETSIQPEQYDMLWVPPYIITYDDFHVTYQNTYYFASALGEWEPTCLFYNKYQMSEVSDIKWMSLTDIAHLHIKPAMRNVQINRFKKIVKKYKKVIKHKHNCIRINKPLLTKNDHLYRRMIYKRIIQKSLKT